MSSEHAGAQVRIQTEVGDMVAEFFPDKAPRHVENFIKLAREGFYDGTRFHRVIPGFMIQGGCPNTKDGANGSPGTGDPGYKIDAEFNDVKHVRGVFSMARSQDPNSAGSQFFICHDAASSLDGKYTAFGRLLEGEDTLDAIVGAPCKPGGEGSSPVEPVMVVKMTVVDPE
jgi:peptidyl-prolyl cis-trans isomerase B (cyclophilin B)